MDQQRWETIKKASKRLVEANCRIEVLNNAERNLSIVFEDSAYPEDVKTRAVDAALTQLRAWALSEQVEAQSIWESL